MKPLDEIESKLRTVIESVPNGIIMADTAGKIVLCNSETERMFKYEKGELVGKEVECLVPAHYRSKHPSYRNNFTEKPSKRQMGAGRDLSGVRKDGSEIPVEIGLNHISTEEGKYIIASIVDISERKRSEERYKLFVDSVKDYAIIMLDPDGKILSWNEGAERLKGYKADEILGEHFSKFYTPESANADYPNKELSIAISEGRYEDENWRIRKDGSRFWASVVITALRDSSGKLQGFGKVTRDLTERKKQEEKFQTIVESVPNGIILINQEGKITLCNSDAEKMFGHTREELLGKPVETLVPARYQKMHPNHREAFKKNPQKRQMGAGRDLSGLRKDGSEFPVEIGLNPIHLPEGNFVLASIVDITERKTIEKKLQTAYEQVQQKNQEMEQFVYTVSHDLKAPLVTSTSFIGFLREDIAKKNFDDVPDSLDRLEKAHKRMQELINDLLQLSRVGRMDLNIEPVNLLSLFEEILENNAESLKNKKVKVTVLKPAPTILADHKRISQVFDNLINNAIKYATDVPSPEIKVFYKDMPDEIQICVKDNGPGIEPQYHKKIFGLFQRLQTDKEGTGVGLTIVSRIVQLHSGRVWVDSDLGRGAEFWVSLPKEPQVKEPLNA